jgi:peptidase E
MRVLVLGGAGEACNETTSDFTHNSVVTEGVTDAPIAFIPFSGLKGSFQEYWTDKAIMRSSSPYNPKLPL